ncbi:MAG: sensor histidine kinase [Pseudonocardia sp.]
MRPRPIPEVLGGLGLDELLGEVQERLTEIAATRDRMQGLLDAVLAMASDLDLDSTLHRIVHAAVDLVDARYGALGVLAPDGTIARFLDVGIDGATRARMGHLPEGKGILGELVLDPRPLRLADLGAHGSSAGFPPHHPGMRTFVGVPVRVRDAVYGNLYLTEKRGGGEFTAADEAVLEALAAAAGIAVQNADLFEQARVRQLWLAASAEIRAELLAGATEDDALALIARRTLELSASAAVSIVLGPDEDGRLTVRAACGTDADAVLGRRMVLDDEPLLAEVVAGRTPVLHGSTARPAPDGCAPHFGPSIAVPLLSQDTVIGVLVGLRHDGAPAYQPTEMPLVTSFAAQATLALELGEKNRAQRRLDVFADRDRIARDLHDHVIQRLFAAGLSLQATLRRSGDPGVERRIQQVVDELDLTVRDIRTAIFDLHAPVVGAETGLRRRLLDTATEATAGSAVVPTVRISGAVDTLVPSGVGGHAVAVVREAVSNAVRHGGAAAVTVTVEAGGELLVDVADDGVGIDPGAARSGLHNLAERAHECGGTLDVTPRRIGGTRVRWRVPLD